MVEQILTRPIAAKRERVITLHSGVLAFSAFLLVVAGLVWGYDATKRTVTLAVNGQALTLRTHQPTIRALLDEAHITLLPEDQIWPPLDTPLAQLDAIQLWLAQPVTLNADEYHLRALTQRESLASVAQELGFRLGRLDRLAFNGQPVEPNQSLATLARLPTDPYASRTPIQLALTQPRLVHVSDDGLVFTISTLAPTVADVLREHNIVVHTHDRVSPALTHEIVTGLHVTIERSKPLTIIADGKTLQARVREKTVGKALHEVGIALTGKDYAVPPIAASVQDNMQVQVKRVREEVIEVALAIPFERRQQPDDELEIDQQRLAQPGKNGELRKQIRVVYEDGAEVHRIVEKEWVARAPTPHITAYGRKVVVRDIQTPYGVLQYWRVVRVYATSYSPARAGTPVTAPWYGRTSAGLKAGKGIVAVDKSVIPWLSKLYVPGYGIGLAGDTGGGVRGRMIDLGFDDDNYESWHEWLDVYLLAPAPSPADIRYILPNTPVERQR
jgi:uncharacterized protein YabE (DUF348 family)